MKCDTMKVYLEATVYTALLIAFDVIVGLVPFLLWVIPSVASGAEPTPTFVVENKMPAFTVVNKVTPSDPRGVWSPVWDGQQWQPRWVKGGVSQTTTPKTQVSGITQGTVVLPVEEVSLQYQGSTSTGHTITLAPTTARLGVTSDCPPGKP